MERLGLLVLLCSSAGAWLVEYSAYPDQSGEATLYAAGVARSSRDVAVNVPVVFDRTVNQSYLQGSVDGELYLYFRHIGYVVPTYPIASAISFPDFATDDSSGVFLVPGRIGIGRPGIDDSHELVARVKHTGALTDCQFSASAFTFKVSPTSSHHVLPKAYTDQSTSVLVPGYQPFNIDAKEYNSYEVAKHDNETRVSLTAAGLTVWQNHTHVELWTRPSVLTHLQDLISMLLMIVALVCVIEVSRDTTKSFNEGGLESRDFTWLTCLVMVDLVWSAAIIMILRIYHGYDMITFKTYGVPPDDLQPAVSACAVALSILSVAVVSATVYDRKVPYLNQPELWWTATRCFYEVLVGMAACACAPPIAGPKFILAVRFSTGIVLAFVIGRDGAFIIPRLDFWPWKVPLVLSLLIVEFLISERLMKPVFWLSQSFPDTGNFIELLAHGVTATIILTGAFVVPKARIVYRQTTPVVYNAVYAGANQGGGSSLL